MIMSQTVQELTRWQTNTHDHIPTNIHYWIQYHLRYAIVAPCTGAKDYDCNVCII